MAYITPQISDFKARFSRDFPFGTDQDTSILDADITTALGMTAINFNSGLWSTQDAFSQGYLLLTAHYLVLNIRAATQGVSGQFNFLQAGKNAGSVSETFSIPERIQANPEFAMLSKTNYGAQYLFIILPLLVGNVFIATGSTTP